MKKFLVPVARRHFFSKRTHKSIDKFEKELAEKVIEKFEKKIQQKEIEVKQKDAENKKKKTYGKKAKNQYWAEVMKITKSQNVETLPNYDLRLRQFHIKHFGGKIFHSDRYYHLDHKISIAYGFKNGISPSVIGDITNLRFIPGSDNIKKGTKCFWD